MEKIKLKKKVILIGNSPINIGPYKNLLNQYPIFAADGGANLLIKKNIDFEAVIGDMDSIKKKFKKNKSIKKIHIKEQNTTDLQKCLNIIDCPTIIGLGFLDKRLDHSLASITAISGFHKAKRVILIGKNDIVIWVDRGWSCKLPIRTRISIWPLGKQKFINSIGLEWSLKDLTLDPINLIGTSNQTNELEIKIFPEKKYRPKYVTLFPNKFLNEIINNLKLE
jgi:thiamine pyrophosphokinase